MLMSANYLAEGRYIEKAKFVWKNYTILLFVGFFAIHLIGLLWSTDLEYGNHDVQIKLPLFALPMAIGSSMKLSIKKFEWVLLFFLATSLVSSFVGSFIYFVLSKPGDDYRLMSPYMSHIRLSLMMGVAVFSSFYLSQKSIQWERFRGWFIGLGFWFIIYLFMLRAMSGIVAVMTAGFILIWLISSKQKMKFYRITKLILISGILITMGYVYWQVRDFYTIDKINLSKVDTHSQNGEEYKFDLNSPMVENGHYTMSFLAENELRTYWNSISQLDYDGHDLKGQNIRHTMIRYLTSKNLRKDQQGLEQLTHQDIWAIENGIANVRFLDGKNLNTLMYRYIWEVHNYRSGFNPQGNSLTQRFLFWEIGVEIFKENWIHGVGTGDTQLAFNEKYENLSFQVWKKYQLRAHNQYLTFGITFGLFGFVYFLWMLFSGFAIRPNSSSYLFIGSFIIMIVSMLDEDTFETQFGITYALFFYFLFLFHQPLKEELIQYRENN